MRAIGLLATLLVWGCSGASDVVHGRAASTGGDDAGSAAVGDDGGGTTGTVASSAAGGGDGGLPDPFAGAPAFAPPATPAASLLDAHSDLGRDITGEDCMGCHTGTGDAPAFLFGGTVYTDATGKTPAVNVEVRVIDSAGHAYSVYSGVDGNFFQRSRGAAGFTFPGHPGVRDAMGNYAMVSDMTGGGCNASKCHDGTSKASQRLYAP
jgi:hypothetical protein